MPAMILWEARVYRLSHSYERLFHALPVCGAFITKVQDFSKREARFFIRIP